MLMMAALVVLPLLATVAHRLWRGARRARQRRRPLEVAGSAETAQERASLRAPRPRARSARIRSARRSEHQSTGLFPRGRACT
jgi:type II secretory pathway pseudopilin PulG